MLRHFLHAAALLYCMSYCSIGVAPPAGCHCWHSAPQTTLFAMVPLLHDAVVQLVGLHLCWLVFMARQQMPMQKNNNQTGIIQKLVASGGWWWQECHHYHGWVDCFHFFAPGSMRITIRRRHQVGFLFFMARQQVPPLKKQSNRHHPEAVVVGFRKLVESRGWWWQKCHHYRGWVDCFDFLHLEACRLPYATAARLDFYFLFLRQGNRRHL